MQEELNKTKEEIMNKIHQGQIKMRPMLYFIFGYILTITGVVFSIVTSIFFVGLTRFSMRAHGRMAQYRLEQLLSSFSWWLPILAILGLVTGVWLLRRYDFSYKINFKVLVVGLILAILLTGLVIDMTGLNDFWLHRGPMRGFQQSNMMNNN